MDKQIDEEINRWMDRLIDGFKVRWIYNTQIVKQMDGYRRKMKYVDGYIDWWINRYMDKQIYTIYIDKQIYTQINRYIHR